MARGRGRKPEAPPALGNPEPVAPEAIDLPEIEDEAPPVEMEPEVATLSPPSIPAAPSSAGHSSEHEKLHG